MDPVSRIEEKLDARIQLVAALAAQLGSQLDRPRSGLLGEEIAAQRAVGGWERSTTPLEAGWYSVLQHVGSAASHCGALTSPSTAHGHFATSALLARGALESLSVMAWLLDPPESKDVRSLRALVEVRYSTEQLKKLYRDQGIRFDGAAAGREAIEVGEALARIGRDARRAAGPGAVVRDRPTFLDLTEALFGRTVAEGRSDPERSSGPLYRFLSAMARGTKWAINHYSTPLRDGEFVGTRATSEFLEMLLFYVGIGLLQVGARAHSQLAWTDLAHLGADEFLDLGPCEVDYGG